MRRLKRVQNVVAQNTKQPCLWICNLSVLAPRHKVAKKRLLQRVLSVTSIAGDRNGIPQERGAVMRIMIDHFLVDLTRSGKSNTVFDLAQHLALLTHQF